MPENNETWRRGAMYTINEAARYADVSTTTVRRWLSGYDRPSGSHAPPVFGDNLNQAFVSFLQLIEICVAARFRHGGTKLEIVSKAHAGAKAKYGIEFPFADLQLEPIGGHIVHVIRYLKSHPSVDSPGLFTLPGFMEALDEQDVLPQSVLAMIEQIEYEGKLAARWYPLGKDNKVVIDPRFASGSPSIKGRGIPIEHIRERIKAQQSIGFICRDLMLSRAQVEDALRYCVQVAA